MSANTRTQATPSRRRNRRSAAQAMVEFGLALPILLLVMYGLIETGRLVFIYASVVSAARQAVRYGSATGDSGSGTPYFNYCGGIRGAAQRLGFLQRISPSDIAITYDEGPGTTPYATSCPIPNALIEEGRPKNGDRINVTVSAPYTPILPFFPFNQRTITSSATRTLLVAVSVRVDSPAVSLPPGSTNLSIQKSATPTGFETVGQVITYSYAIRNLSTEVITDIYVADDNIDPIAYPDGRASCPSTTLAPGGAFVCQATHIVTQADIDKGTLTNHATVWGLGPDGAMTASASLDMNFVPRPEITLDKSGKPAPLAERGQAVPYTFTIKNTGNVTLTGPYTVTDPNLDTLDCTSQAVSPLLPGASTVCTGTHLLTNNDIQRTYIVNTATATAKYGEFVVTSNSDTETVLVPELMLSITGSPSPISALGATITYTYTVTNRKPVAISNIQVTDIRGASHMPCVPSLAASGSTGDSGSCTRTYTGYTQADLDSGVIHNQGTATAQGGVNSNTAIGDITVTQSKVLTLDKTASVTEAYTLNAPITYHFKLTNGGNVTLSPPFTIADNRIPNISCSGITTPLAPYASANCSDKLYNVTQADIDAGSILNTATATGMFGLEKITGTDTWLVKTWQGPRLGIKKSADRAFFTSAGQAINYTFTLTNLGSIDLTSPYVVTDTPPISITCPQQSGLPVGGSINCTGSYVVTLQNTTDGFVFDSASATAVSTSDGSTITSASASLTVPRFQCTASRLTHLDPTPIPSGQDITWTIVNNTGLAVHIQSITISWSSIPPSLDLVTLGGATIWNTKSISNGVVIPGGPWLLPTGNTNMQLHFSQPASSIRIVLTFVESQCNFVVDSNTKIGT